MVRLPGEVCHQYVALSRFNSPYAAHEHGHAVDLYPERRAPSPVGGEVVRHRRVRAPPRPYAETYDHLLVIDTGDHLARLLHVEPTVDVGDTVEVGADLGRLVRSGYFAPWVDNHLHLGFRPPDVDPVRATGSLPLELGVGIEAVHWDGTGTVIETGRTHVVLDRPEHRARGEHFAGIATDSATDRPTVGPVLDGGLPHYDGGGIHGGWTGPVSLLGTRIGEARAGRVTWNDVEVWANGEPVTGLSLAVRRGGLGAKLVSWDGPPASVGDRVEVSIVTA